MKKFFGILLVAVVAVSAFCGSLKNEKFTLEQRLEQAVQKGKAEEAALWATAINQVAQARHHDEARQVAEKTNKLLNTYANVFKSIPAILDGVERVAEFNKDAELVKFCQFGKSLMVVTERPLSDKEITPIADYAIREQAAASKAAEEPNKKWGI